MEKEFTNFQETTSISHMPQVEADNKHFAKNSDSKYSQAEDDSSLEENIDIPSVNSIENLRLFTDETNNDLDNYLNTSLPECSQFLKEYDENYFECKTIDHLNKNIKRRYQKKARTTKNKFFKSATCESESISTNNEIPVINEAINKIFKPLTLQPIVINNTPKKTLKSYSRHKNRHTTESFGLPDKTILPSPLEYGFLDLHNETVDMDDIPLSTYSWMNTTKTEFLGSDDGFRESNSYVNDHIITPTDYENLKHAISEDFSLEENIETNLTKEKESEGSKRLPKVLLKLLDLNNEDMYKSNNLSLVKNKKELLYERLKNSTSIENIPIVSEMSINESENHIKTKLNAIDEKRERATRNKSSPRKSDQLKSPTNQQSKEKEHEKSLGENFKKLAYQKIKKEDSIVLYESKSSEKINCDSPRRLTRQSYNKKDNLDCLFSEGKICVRSKSSPDLRMLKKAMQSDRTVLVNDNNQGKNCDNFENEHVEIETRNNRESRRKSSRVSKSFEKFGTVINDSSDKFITNRVCIIKTSPEKISPKKNSPRKNSPRKNSPRKNSPRKNSPRKNSPKKINANKCSNDSPISVDHSDLKKGKESPIKKKDKIVNEEKVPFELISNDERQSDILENNNIRNVEESIENTISKIGANSNKDQEILMESLQKQNDSLKDSSKFEEEKSGGVSLETLETLKSSRAVVSVKKILEIDESSSESKIPKRIIEPKKSPLKKLTSNYSSEEDENSEDSVFELKLKMRKNEEEKLSTHRKLRSNAREDIEEYMPQKNMVRQRRIKKKKNYNEEKETIDENEDGDGGLNQEDSHNLKKESLSVAIQLEKIDSPTKKRNKRWSIPEKTLKIEKEMGIQDEESSRLKEMKNLKGKPQNEQKTPLKSPRNKGKSTSDVSTIELNKNGILSENILSANDLDISSENIEENNSKKTSNRRSLRLKANIDISTMKSPEKVILKQQNGVVRIEKDNLSTESEEFDGKEKNWRKYNDGENVEKRNVGVKQKFNKKSNNEAKGETKNCQSEKTIENETSFKFSKEKRTFENDKVLPEEELTQFKKEIEPVKNTDDDIEMEKVSNPIKKGENLEVEMENEEKSLKIKKKPIKDSFNETITSTSDSDGYLDVGYDTFRRTSFRKILEKVMELSRKEMKEKEMNNVRKQRCRSVPYEKSIESSPLHRESASANSKFNFSNDRNSKIICDRSKVKKKLDYSVDNEVSPMKRSRTKSMYITKFQIEGFEEKKENFFGFGELNCCEDNIERYKVEPNGSMENKNEEVVSQQQNGCVSPTGSETSEVIRENGSVSPNFEKDKSLVDLSGSPRTVLDNDEENCLDGRNGVSTMITLGSVSALEFPQKNVEECSTEQDAGVLFEGVVVENVESSSKEQNGGVSPIVVLENTNGNVQVEENGVFSEGEEKGHASLGVASDLGIKSVERTGEITMGDGNLLITRDREEATNNDDQQSRDQDEEISEIDFALSNGAFNTDCESDFYVRDVNSRASSVGSFDGKDGASTSRRPRSSMRKSRRSSRRYGRSSSRRRIAIDRIERELAEGDGGGDMVASKAAGKVFYEFKVGDLIWGKVGNHPYWPCMIVTDPDTSEFKKYKLLRTTPYYHVRFFGDKGRRAWTTHVILYEGPDDLEEMEKRLWRKGVQTNYIKECYCVKPTQLNKWKQAVSEAEIAKNEPLDRKLTFFDRQLKEERNKRSKRSEDFVAVKARKTSRKRKNEGGATSSSSSEDDAEDPCSSQESTITTDSLPKKRKKRTKRRSDANDDDADDPCSSQESTITTDSLPKKRKKRTKRRSNINDDIALELLEITANPLIMSTPETKSHTVTRSRSSSRPKKPEDVVGHAEASAASTSKSLPVKEKKQATTMDQSDTESKASDNSHGNVSNLSEFKKNLFRGVPKEKVCQICEKGADVVKCRGACNGDYHVRCVKESLRRTQDLLEDPIKVESRTKEEKEVCGGSDNDQVQIITLGSRRMKKMLADGIALSPGNKNNLPLGERIDQKMKEIMKKVDTGFVEFTDSSGEETGSIDELKVESPTEIVKTLTPIPVAVQLSANNKSQRSKGNVFKHVTADEVSIISIDDEGKTEEIAIPNETPSVVDETTYRCPYCATSSVPPCFICNALISTKGNAMRQRCSMQKCGRYYHSECLNAWPQTQWSFILDEKKKSEALDIFVCPRHTCHICASESFGCSIGRCPNDKLVKCLRCPATYHNSYHCVPAGTQILTSTQVICPRHVKKNTSNTVWCFVCSEGGNLTCCETCPTSVHAECLPVNLLEDDTYMCEDCESGRFPLYGEVVWVKCGNFRWWPAIVMFPSEIPTNVEAKPRAKGDFVVRFFGTYDYFWVGRGRAFLYQEGDTGCLNSHRNKIDEAFCRALKEAEGVYRLKKESKTKREKEVNNGLKPPPYVRIKVNRPVGNVRVFDGNLSNTTSCDCDPNDANPCGPNSNCLNRILMTECNPEVCPAGQRCKNQCFEKREYPRVAPYRTPSRGWGLKTLEPIEKGRFVIEYVGEIIDDEEYQRRLKRMHQQKDENYYFLTIDNNRMLDAGPKGNVARFMNHSCNPNCETQKWTVNGDTRVGLFAIDDIPCDTELTFNYNLECAGDSKKICRCGAPNCSGYIGVKTDEPKPSKRRRNVRKRSIKIRNVDKGGPCFVCGKENDAGVGKCSNKSCNKSYHLGCLRLEAWPDGKWNCPCHSCNICARRTMRSCVKCTNSYCPKHSAGNVRHEENLGFVCAEHDPNKTKQRGRGRPRKKQVEPVSAENSTQFENERKRRRDSPNVKLPSPKKMKFDDNV